MNVTAGATPVATRGVASSGSRVASFGVNGAIDLKSAAVYGTGQPIDGRVTVVRLVENAQMRFGESYAPFGDAAHIRLDGIDSWLPRCSAPASRASCPPEPTCSVALRTRLLISRAASAER